MLADCWSALMAVVVVDEKKQMCVAKCGATMHSQVLQDLQATAHEPDCPCQFARSRHCISPAGSEVQGRGQALVTKAWPTGPKICCCQRRAC